MTTTTGFVLECLPSELLDRILDNLSTSELGALAKTSWGFYNYTLERWHQRALEAHNNGYNLNSEGRLLSNIILYRPHCLPSVFRTPALSSRLHNAASEIRLTMLGDTILGIAAAFQITQEEARSMILEAEVKPFRPSIVAVSVGDVAALKKLQHHGWGSFPYTIGFAAAWGLGYPIDPNRLSLHWGPEREEAAVMVDTVLSASMPRSCKQRFLTVLSSGFQPSSSTPISVFQMCSREPPDCDRAVSVLRSLLQGIRNEDGSYPDFAIDMLRTAFSDAVDRARVFYHKPMKVVAEWLEMCEPILAPRRCRWRWYVERRDVLGLCSVLYKPSEYGQKLKCAVGEHLVPGDSYTEFFPPDLRSDR